MNAIMQLIESGLDLAFVKCERCTEATGNYVACSRITAIVEAGLSDTK